MVKYNLFIFNYKSYQTWSVFLKPKKSWVKSIKSVNLNFPVGRQVQIDKVKFFQAASFVLLFSKHITIISFFNIKIKLISLNCKVSLFRVRLFISSIDRTAKNTSRRIGTWNSCRVVVAIVYVRSCKLVWVWKIVFNSIKIPLMFT